MTREITLVVGQEQPFRCPDCGHDDAYTDEQQHLVVVHEPSCPALLNPRLKWHAENEFLEAAYAAGIGVADYGEVVLHEAALIPTRHSR